MFFGKIEGIKCGTAGLKRYKIFGSCYSQVRRRMNAFQPVAESGGRKNMEATVEGMMDVRGRK